MALTAAVPHSGATWLMAQGLLTAARAAGEAPLLRAVRICGTGWARMTFWGMRFAPGTLAQLQADPDFAAARGRGEVAELVSATMTPDSSPAPLWLVALSELARPPLYLPPSAQEVAVQLRTGGSARYRFQTVVYPLASS